MTKPIFLAGDSWGVGTFNVDVPFGKDPVRTKIEYFFQDTQLINVSMCGESNHKNINEIEKNITNDYTFVWIQTDPFRDITDILKENDPNPPTAFEQIHAHLKEWLCNTPDVEKEFFASLHKSYSRLNTIAAKHDKKIYCIGGCQEIRLSDTEKYQNLEVVIPSIVKFLHPSITDKYIIYSPSIVFMKEIKKYRTSNLNFNKNIDWLSQRWIETHDFFVMLNARGQEGHFWPDAFHPNEVGILLWTDYLKKITLI